MDKETGDMIPTHESPEQCPIGDRFWYTKLTTVDKQMTPRLIKRPAVQDHGAMRFNNDLMRCVDR